MKYLITSVITGLLFFVFFPTFKFTQNKAKSKDLWFKGETNKETYILGEPVRVQFEFVNKGETSVIIPKFGVEVGSLKIFIAGSDGQYKQYIAPSWGKLTGDIINLKPKQSHKFEEAFIFWKPVINQYAFPDPGVYFIKGVSYIGENSVPIESEPIQIVVNEPLGNDSEVWNQIKDNHEIAYLMQAGTFNTENNEKRVEVTREIEGIIENYPNSTYSNYLKPSLEKYKVKEERRKKDRDARKQQQED